MTHSFFPNATGPSSLTRRWVAFVLRHGKIIWAVALLLGAFGAWRTHYVYSRLRSELEELLPRSSKSVLAIDELRERVSGLQYLGVVVDTVTAENVPAAERMLDDLAARIRGYPPDLVRAVRTGNTEERDFFEKHAALYVDATDLERILARIEARRDWEVSRQEGSNLDDDNAAPPSLDFSDIQKKYEDKIKGRGKTENGRFESSELHTALLLIEAASFSSAQGKGAVLLHRVEADLAALGGPEHYAPGMRVGYSGDIAITVEETSALVSDLSFSSILVGVLVLGSIIYFFRWWPSIIILLLPLSIATVLSFGIASMPPFHVTELNSNTAFLGAIIVGNGINVGIMLLSRYVEERRRGLGVEPALDRAVWGVRPGTLSAALAASTSYVSLVLTQFRGFRQFGIIGGLGMVLAWISAFVLIPPLTAWLDRKGHAPKPVTRTGLTSLVAHLVKRRSTALVVVATFFTIGAVLLIVRIGDNQLEHDFSKLRRRDTWEVGEGYWGRKMDALLGAYLTPTAILTDDAEHARRAAAAVRKERDEGKFGDLVTTVRTIDDVLPQHQEEKIALLERIEDAMTPRMRASVPEDKRKEVERLLDRAETKPVSVEDLPRTFTTGLREKDGHVDRIVLVYPKPSKALWEGRALSGYITRLREIARDTTPPGVAPARVAGSLALSTDILESIRRDGPRASLAALAGVMVIVLVLFRFTTATAEVIGSLLVGVAWMLGLSIGFNIKINFANFIAFPITFGIGVEYAVNVMTRYMQDGAKDTSAAVRATGGAVALCSATTIIGYSSLLMAQNRALFLFGLLAVIGEITCLTAAVVALPAFLEWRTRR
ncbi:MAG: MMPL family transporter [Polyangiaceae bacterium]|nr:MMPL family transporter [Polyangiaceae bacterium]